LVLHDLELDRLAEFSNKQHNTLQNSKRDYKGSKPDAIGLLARCNGNGELKKIDQRGVGLGQQESATK
jgi:hypothetical protein